MIKAFGLILLVSLFSQFASARVIDLDQTQIDLQTPFTGEQVQQNLNSLVQSYAESESVLKTSYLPALQKVGIHYDELTAAEKIVASNKKTGFLISCARALLGSDINHSVYAELRTENKLDQFTDFVLRKGLKTKISIHEAIDKSAHHAVFGHDGIHNKIYIAPAHLLLLPSALRNYENTEKAEKLVDEVVMHLSKFELSPTVELAKSKKAYITVNRIEERSKGHTTYDVTVHTPCGHKRLTRSFLDTTVIAIVQTMAALNMNSQKLHSACR